MENYKMAFQKHKLKFYFLYFASFMLFSIIAFYSYWYYFVDVYIKFNYPIPTDKIKVLGVLEKKIKNAIIFFPDEYSMKNTMAINVGSHLMIGNKSYIVQENEIVLFDWSGVMSWKLENIRIELDKYGDSNIPNFKEKKEEFEKNRIKKD